mmetsp:Transcript_68913/g.155906  ORF Transcript_68913/g.155906 Transcript_68913/m.155906 type:complete len:317 (+) Transcript_68913:224-1174(+)
MLCVCDVQGLVRVVGCERVTLVVACRRLLISSCVDSVFPVFCASHPLLAGDNRACQFAPYNTAYDELVRDLGLAALPLASPPAVNHWNSPIDANSFKAYSDRNGAMDSLASPPLKPKSPLESSLSGLRSPLDSPETPAPEAEACPGEAESGAAMLPPKYFATLTVPARPRGCPRGELGPPCNPFALPSEYAEGLREKLECAVAAHAALEGMAAHPRGDPRGGLEERAGSPATEGSASRGPQPGPDERREEAEAHKAKVECVEAALRGHFGEWLVTSSKVRQVLDLVQIDRARHLKLSEQASDQPQTTKSLSAEMKD